MQFLRDVLDAFLHLDVFLDRHLNEWAAAHGLWLPYGVLFLILFCETGLVVTPFLPGDSLLFAVGALAAIQDSPLSLWILAVILSVGAILGDAVNYSIGLRLGPKVFSREDSRLLNRKHLLRTQRFYEKHGGKTIFLARFIPIIRTFAPFVAGIGKMQYRRFAIYNVTGGIVWIASFLAAGYIFGNVPLVKRNFHIVIVAIVVISCVPVAIEFLRARKEARLEAEAARALLEPDPKE
jgi:membrane-associated protein